MQLDYQDYIIPGNSRNGYILFAIQKANTNKHHFSSVLQTILNAKNMKRIPLPASLVATGNVADRIDRGI